MINVQHNIVNEEQFPYLKLPTQGLERYEHTRYSALRIDHADFSALLYTLFNKILETHQPYFVYIESKPQPTRAVRSHKKMLYQELQSGQLLPAEVWEEELKTSDGAYSLLSAAIQGSRDNIPYILEEQLHANFRFGCILPKEAAFSPAAMLRALPDFLRSQSKLTRVDLPKLLQHFSAQQAHLFHLPFDANDKLKFSLFAHRQDVVFAKILAAIDEEFALPERN